MDRTEWYTRNSSENGKKLDFCGAGKVESESTRGDWKGLLINICQRFKSTQFSQKIWPLTVNDEILAHWS